ncbi:hypothetical protein B0I35DRAFT_485162 [Stachybotrys elegans]|uniref:Fucose-specific lectin n=1 Tax=Stachybotrys elegans TaxID=80388 RepID=A0A8K0WKK1_9HYPO|nr:hypothetical protein B0I35DRAFT_485162 [Stachybotrys elegans]
MPPEQHGEVHHDGLEVVPDKVEKIIVPREAPKIVIPRQEGLEVARDNPDEHMNPPSAEPHIKNTPSWWKRRQFIILFVLFVMALIVGAVLGGVLGSRAVSSATESAETSASSSIAPGSPLAATAIRRSDNYYIILGYRDAEANLKVSIRSSTYDTPNATWGRPLTLGPRLHNESNIAISAYVVDNMGDLLQFSIFYANESSYVQSQTWSSFNGTFIGGAINRRGLRASSPPRIAAFGPFLDFTDELGDFGGLELDGANRQIVPVNISSNADLFGFTQLAGRSTRLAMIPLQTNVTTDDEDAAGKWFMTMLFQKDGGAMAAMSSYHFRAGSILDADEMASWPEYFAEIAFPLGSAFAAFSTARAANSTLVNIFILYRHEDGDIRQAQV